MIAMLTSGRSSQVIWCMQGITPGVRSAWVPGRIDERTGPVSLAVELEDHRMTRRHQDQIFSRKKNNGEDDNDNSGKNWLEEQSGAPTVAEMDVQQASGRESIGSTTPSKRNHEPTVPHKRETKTGLLWSRLSN